MRSEEQCGGVRCSGEELGPVLRSEVLCGAECALQITAV